LRWDTKKKLPVNFGSNFIVTKLTTDNTDASDLRW
jgi:hypothetical protein